MNQSKPIVFLHIPKTAGTSLRNMFCGQHKWIFPEDMSNIENVHPLLDKAIFNYQNNGWMSLQRLIDWNNNVTFYYDEKSFNFSFLQIPNTELWNYWVNNVTDKSYNEIIEIHLNKQPPPDFDIHPGSYDYTTSTIVDFMDNKLYNNFDWVTILRNPIERVISEFYFIDKFWYGGAEVAFRVWSHIPEESRYNILKYSNFTNTHNTQIKYLMGKGYLSDYIVTEKDCDELIDRMESLNFKVGITEKMSASIDNINKWFDMNINYSQFGHVRKNNSKPSVGGDIKKLIEENNKWDMKLYNYFLNKMEKE